jgi:hypothetical protein
MVACPLKGLVRNIAFAKTISEAHSHESSGVSVTAKACSNKMTEFYIYLCMKITTVWSKLALIIDSSQTNQ